MIRRIRAWFYRPVNLLDFGADPTGIADSTAAIQAALNKADSRMGWLPTWLWLPRWLLKIAARRRTVIVPTGTYFVTAILAVDRTTLAGEGTQNSILTPKAMK